MSEFWKQLSNAVFSPRISEEELSEKLQALRQQLPTPVFWLLGKTQSGKTSIIRTLTGRSDAEIGNGFQACTRTARQYEFPTPEDCLIRFLDTRGLGEVDYDPSEDLALFQAQAHVLIVTMKAMDHAQHRILATLQDILRARPHWPVIVAQSCLHEGYPNPATEHALPYPYQNTPFPTGLPADLVRSLLYQRSLFDSLPNADKIQFVPIDFTLPEDGYAPDDYGIDALWEAIETALPMGLRSMIASCHRQQLSDVYGAAAHPHIIAYAVLAGGAGAIPVPLVGTPLVISIQAKMCHTIASIYGQEMNARRFAEIGSTLGISYALGLGGRELIKLIPVYGSVVSSAYTAAVTYALGKTLSAYFSYALEGCLPEQAVFEQIYQTELKRGREMLSEYLANLRKKPVSTEPPALPSDKH